MDLSVIIPVHNLENHIRPMLVSLLLQNLTDIEVQLIFVCDNCTDRTKEIIQEFDFSEAKTYADICVCECDVKSCGLARNEGLELALGKYIMFLDGDDWLISTEVFRTIIWLFTTHPDEKVFRYDYTAPKFFAAYGHPAMVWQYAYTREILGDTRFTPIQPHEDWEFNQAIFAKINNQVLFCKEKLYHYNYMRQGSNMQQLHETGVIKP